MDWRRIKNSWTAESEGIVYTVFSGEYVRSVRYYGNGICGEAVSFGADLRVSGYAHKKDALGRTYDDFDPLTARDVVSKLIPKLPVFLKERFGDITKKTLRNATDFSLSN